MQFFIKLLHVKGLFIKTLLFTFCGALWLLSLTSCKSSAGKEKKILIVESYEKTYKGYENNKAKIEALFKKEGIKASLHFIYLDSEQYLEEQETERMRNLVDAENGWKPDLIMVFNDQATYSLMKCGASLSQSVPIIFAGVNFPNWKIIRQHPNMRGFWDKPAYLKTVDLATKLLGPLWINMWFDDSFLSQKATYSFFKELNEHGEEIEGAKFALLPGERFEFITTPPSGIPLSSRPDHTRFVYYNVLSQPSLIWNITFQNPYSAYIQCFRDYTSQRLGNKLGSPVFTAINVGLGYKEGVIGGYITSRKTEQKLAVHAASIVLKSGKINSVGIAQTPKQYVVDWVEMKRWEIDMNKLPDNCEILNVPVYIRYRGILIILICVIVGSIVLFIIHNRRTIAHERDQRKKAERLLKEEDRFHSMAISGGKIFAFCLKDGLYLFDEEFYKTNGLTFAPITYAEFRGLLHPDDRKQLEKTIEECHNSPLLQQNIIQQRRLNSPSKGYIWWEFRYLYDRSEESISGVCLNIDESKRNEQLLIEAKRKAEESDHIKSTFVANMSHEVRTPLNAIVGFANLIAEQHEDLSQVEMDQYCALINNNCDMLLKLINDILDLTRMESGKMKYSFESCNLNDLFQRIYRTERQLIPECLELKIDIPEKPVFFCTDYLRLTQVITNIINNSAKFTNKGYISFGYTSVGNDRIRITIEDTGQGIPAEQQQAVFERFTKLNSFMQGAGLRLSICQGIIQALNGQIELTSEVGKGTRFLITLPSYQANATNNKLS